MMQRTSDRSTMVVRTLTLEEHVDHIMEEKQCTSKEAIKEVAIQRGLSKREVYQNYHVE